MKKNVKMIKSSKLNISDSEIENTIGPVNAVQNYELWQNGDKNVNKNTQKKEIGNLIFMEDFTSATSRQHS